VTYLLVALLVVMVTPLLTASWRLSLVGLGMQGLLMTAMVAQRGWPVSGWGVVILLDLLVLRTWFVPRHLFAIMRRLGGPERSDVLPANLLSWTMAGALVLVAFRFAALIHPEGGLMGTHVAVAAAGLLLGLLVLGTQASTVGQIIGVLRIEYAIALFELASGHEVELPVQLGVTAVLLLSVLTLGSFLGRLGAAGPDQQAAPERKT
jgi:hydrogenase-4 component E